MLNLYGVFSTNELFVYLTFVSYSKGTYFFIYIIVVFFMQIRSDRKVAIFFSSSSIQSTDPQALVIYRRYQVYLLILNEHYVYGLNMLNNRY